jgi:hypothetical protein
MAALFIGWVNYNFLFHINSFRIGSASFVHFTPPVWRGILMGGHAWNTDYTCDNTGNCIETGISLTTLGAILLLQALVRSADFRNMVCNCFCSAFAFFASIEIIW